MHFFSSPFTPYPILLNQQELVLKFTELNLHAVTFQGAAVAYCMFTIKNTIKNIEKNVVANPKLSLREK